MATTTRRPAKTIAALAIAGLFGLFGSRAPPLAVATTATAAAGAGASECVQGEDDISVLDCLLKNYDILERPQRLTVVNVSFATESVSSPDEISLEYTLRVEILHRYVDERLRFLPRDGFHPRGVNAWYHMTRIWRPFITVVENQKSPSFDAADACMTIYPNGLVEYYRKVEVQLNCRTVLERFPFDNPVCLITAIAAGFSKDEVELRWIDASTNITQPSTVIFNSYPRRSTLAPCSAEEVHTFNAACLKAMVLFSRERSIYWVTVFIPGFVMVTSAFMSFWLSVKAAPPRAMIGTTTRLNFLSSANTFRNKLPSVSNLVALNIWDSVSIIFIYVSLLEFIFVDYLDRHPRAGEEADAQYLERVLRRPELSAWERFCFYFRKPNKAISSDIDVMCRIVFPVLYFGFIIGYFITYQGCYSHDLDYTYAIFKDLIS